MIQVLASLAEGVDEQSESKDVRSTSPKFKYAMNIYSHHGNPNLYYLQNWAGSVLNDTQWVEDFTNLQGIRNSVIILETEEANHQFDITQRLARSNNTLIFCSFFGSGSAGEFQQLIDDLDSDLDIYLLSSSSYSQLPSINLNEWRYRQADYPNRLKADSAFEDIYRTQNKPFGFCWVNTRSRVQRRRLWRLLEDRDLLRQGLCSWTHSCEAAPDWDATQERKIDLCALPPKYLATSDGNQEPDRRRRYNMLWREYRSHWSENSIIPPRMQDSYFTVYVESDIQEPCLTHTIYDCILAGHPFMVLGAPTYYQYLRDLGFQTFEPWIDEGFAQGHDLDRRLEQMADAIQQLCRIDLDSWLQQVRPICEHNRRHFIDSQWDHWYQTHLELDRFFRGLLSRDQN